MQVEATTQFLTDLKSIRDKKLRKKVLATIEHLEQISDLSEINQLKKMKGFRNAYRLRVGDYRLGFLLEKNTIVLGRFLSRQEIYKRFP